MFLGGVLGTVKLLLKQKKDSLSRLSGKVGYDIRSNNETLMSVYSSKEKVNLSKGITIGSILRTDENSHKKQSYYYLCRKH